MESPPDSDGGGAADMQVVDPDDIHGAGEGDDAVPPELREQALGLISDAQTAGDRREKELLLKQVEELVLHRCPALLDEVVPTLIAAFQADPVPGIRKLLAEILESVVKAHPSFCQPGMVDVYSHALQYDDSPVVIKRVLVAATNVHRVVLRYAAHSGLAQIWTDYCRRVKQPALAMRDDGVRMADPGIAQGVMKFLEACILTGSAPARASSVFPRADDSFSVADLMAAYDAQTQDLFGVEDMRREAQELLGHSLLGWLSQGNAAFKAPHWSFLVNTLSSIATHRTQFLPLIAGTLGGLLAARFAPEEEAGAGGGGHGHLHPPAVTQVLKSSCLKLARLPAVRPHPLALESLAKGLKAAGMDSELKPLAPYLPEGLRAELLGEVEEEGREEGASSSKRPRRGAAAPEQPPAQAAQQQRRDPRQQLRGVVVGQGVGGQQPQQEQQQPPPPELMAVPPRWYKTNAPERAQFVLGSLHAVPLPPAPYRDPRLQQAGQQHDDADALVVRLCNELTRGQPAVGLGFIAEVGASSRQEMPMALSGEGMGNEALTELIMVEGDKPSSYSSTATSTTGKKAPLLSGSGLVGDETLPAHAWAARRKEQTLGAVDRLLWGSEGLGGTRVCVVSRLLCLMGGGAARAPPAEEEGLNAGPTLPMGLGGEDEGKGKEKEHKANVAAIAALASTQGAIGHALSYLVEDYAARRELADRLLYELFLWGLLDQPAPEPEPEGVEEEDEEPTAATTDNGEAGGGSSSSKRKRQQQQRRDWERRRARKGMELYDVVFLALCRRLVARLDGRDKERLLTTAYLTAPRLPSRALDLLSECLEDKTGARVMQGLMTLVELAVYRPMAQEDCLHRVLHAAVHPNADVRRQAIQRAVLKRLYRLEELQPQIEAFARAQLDSAVQGTPPPEPPATSSSRSSSKSSKGGGSSKRSKPSSSSEPAAPLTAEEEEEGIKRRVYLYLSLCAKNEALVGGVFEAYAAAAAAGAASEGGEGGNRAAVVMRVLEGEMDAFVKHVVTPHGAGPVLSSLVGAPPLASPLILTVLNLLVPETQARPRPPAPEVVAAAKSLRELRGGDVAYLLPVLGGLTREEMERDVLPPLMEGDRVDERLLKRMIMPYGPLSNAEALVALHNVDPEQAKIPLKKYLDTLQKCLGMKTLFPQTALTLALVKMVEDRATPVPYAYMRSVILAIRTYPGLKAVVADTIVPKLVEREVWASQPRVWEGMVLLPKYVGAREVTDKMSEALVLLPAPQLQDLIKKNPDVRAVLVAHVTRAKKQAALDAARRKALGL